MRNSYLVGIINNSFVLCSWILEYIVKTKELFDYFVITSFKELITNEHELNIRLDIIQFLFKKYFEIDENCKKR